MMDLVEHDFRNGDRTAPRGPVNLEAEHALLGAVLLANEAYHLLDGAVTPQSFAEPFHGRLWGRMAQMIGHNLLAEPITLMDAFDADPAFKMLGGLVFLSDLVANAPPTAMAPEFARVVADNATRRELIRLAGEIAASARTGADMTAHEMVLHAEREFSALADDGPAASAWESAGSITGAAINTARTRNGMVGLSTGLADLDDAMGGLRKGQLIIVAGRPAMGKSTAALQLAKAVAQRGKGALFFSMEMPDFDLGLRLACDVAHDVHATRYMGRSDNPSYFDAARGRLTGAQWTALDDATATIKGWPLEIDTRAGLTVSKMLAAARRKFRDWKRAGIEPGVIIVDHLTIARAEKERQGNKVAEVGDISRGLAEMAKALDIPVVALCQLSRDVEKRDKDKRPTLADLRWSGEIEQDARVVMFLYRPEYYVRKPEDDKDPLARAEHHSALEKVRHKLFWLIEKNNNGPTGQVETYCDIACSAIRDHLGDRRA